MKKKPFHIQKAWQTYQVPAPLNSFPSSLIYTCFLDFIQV